MQYPQNRYLAFSLLNHGIFQDQKDATSNFTFTENRFLAITDANTLEGIAPSVPVLELYKPSGFWQDIPQLPLESGTIEGGGLVNDRMHVCGERRCFSYDPVTSDWVLEVDREDYGFEDYIYSTSVAPVEGNTKAFFVI